MITLNISDEGPVRIIELNRPEALNALNGQMTDDLADAFLAAADELGGALLSTLPWHRLHSNTAVSTTPLMCWPPQPSGLPSLPHRVFEPSSPTIRAV